MITKVPISRIFYKGINLKKKKKRNKEVTGKRKKKGKKKLKWKINKGKKKIKTNKK